MVVNGARTWGSGFIPAVHQGTLLENGSEPISNLNNPVGITNERQAGKLDFLNQLNRSTTPRVNPTPISKPAFAATNWHSPQAEAPEAIDLDGELSK